MRQFLAVAILGASLALAAGSAFASERVDNNYYAPREQTQTVASENQGGPVQSTVAGDQAPTSVYGGERYDNFGN